MRGPRPWRAILLPSAQTDPLANLRKVVASGTVSEPIATATDEERLRRDGQASGRAPQHRFVIVR